MPAEQRQHRCSYDDPGDAHELTFSCYQGYKFLASQRVRVWLRDALDAARREFEFGLWAYVFMPEHVHLVVCPWRKEYRIAEIRRAIKEPVGRAAMKHLRTHRPDWLPRLTRQRGKRQERLFWQSGGGYDRNINEPRTLMSMIEYIHLNPVRRGLAERAVDWEWSSAAQLEGISTSPVALDPIPAEWLDSGV
jgi:putative transposase